MAELTIQKILLLTPLLVEYKEDGVVKNECFLVDFIYEKIHHLDGTPMKNPVLEGEIIKIIQAKKKTVAEPNLPLESIEFALKNKEHKWRQK